MCSRISSLSIDMDTTPRLARFQNWALLLARLSIGASFIVHGYFKLPLWQSAPDGMPAGLLNVMRLLSVCEPLGGIAMILGVFTLPAAVGLTLVMLGAITLKNTDLMHLPFAAPGGWELDLAMLGQIWMIGTFGPGKISIKNLFKKKK